MLSPNRSLNFLILALLLSALAGAARGDVMLQYFDGSHASMENRMPDIFMAGYDSIWIPPTGVADSGGFSVGYDVFDRFNQGTPFWRTLYGTEAELMAMMEQAQRAGIRVYVDIIMNHNGFRDLSTPGFHDSGGYPGFVLTLPEDIDGDFHGAFETGDLRIRLAGLIDIAQEKNHLFIRHPVDPGDTRNIPNQIAREENRRFYPDTDPTSPAWLGDTSGDRRTPSGFNLDNPLAGDPVPENATGLLVRYVQWMNEVVGVDGFRLDAVKHVPQFFWNDFYDPALFGKGPGGSTPFSFGEVFDGDFGLLDSYTRKDGFGNRDVLDFPLYFRMREILNGSGFGDMRDLEFASFDGSDGSANDGSRGVMFVSSHDSGPPAADNVAYAHILTRPGYPIVYFNALEFGDGRDFPLRGRGDALGGQFGDIIIRLLDIHRERARGAHITRWIDQDVYVYERDRALVVGLNDNGATARTVTIQTGFRDTTLVELTGNAGASPSVSIGSDGTGTFTVPANADGMGYAAWSLQAPRAPESGPALTISPVSSIIGPDPADRPNGVRRLTPLEVITAPQAVLELALRPDGLDDNALLSINGGRRDVLSSPTGILEDGEFAGFQPFMESDPGANGGAGTYAATIDVTQLEEGPHYIEAIAFLRREADSPPLFESFRKVIYVDRHPPEMALRFPTQTGDKDIQSPDFEVVIDCLDRTADSVHVLVDFAGTDSEAIAAVTEANRATQVDRGEFRFNWTEIPPGLRELTVVAFEPTGRAGVTRFGNIDVDITLPQVVFRNLPERVDTLEYNDIEIWVNTTNPDGPDFVFDPSGTTGNTFRLELSVNGVVYEALPFDPSLVGSENTLFQNDTDLGDEFDVFRFNWRGYAPGLHLFEATAQRNDGVSDPSAASRSVQVPPGIPGPAFSITMPPPPAAADDPPTRIAVAPQAARIDVSDVGEEARSLSAFIQMDGGEQLFATAPVDGGEASVTLASQPGAVAFTNGIATLRVRSATAPPGGGITREESTQLLVVGATDPPGGGGDPIVVDGQDNDWPGLAPAEIHTAATSGLEWIYTGEAGDSRTDLGFDTDINNTEDEGDYNSDLTELRIRAGAEKIYFLARFRDITDPRLPSFAIAIDTNEPGDTTSVSFIGDESDTWLDTSNKTWDYTIQVHFTTGNASRVEVFDDVDDGVFWFSPEGEQSFISAENNVVEFAIPRSALGLVSDGPQTISIQAATFENQLFDDGEGGLTGWNNDVDSTRDIPGSPDALDVLGGKPGVSENAFGRAFGNGNNIIDNDDPGVQLVFDVVIPSPGDSASLAPPEIISVDPGEAAQLATTTPVVVSVVTNANTGSVYLGINSVVRQAVLVSEDGFTRTWEAETTELEPGENDIVAAAFERARATGRSAYRQLTYTVEGLSAADVAAYLLGARTLDAAQRTAADANGDGVIDAADVLLILLAGE